jgi:hypothetical protein
MSRDLQIGFEIRLFGIRIRIVRTLATYRSLVAHFVGSGIDGIGNVAMIENSLPCVVVRA